MKIPSHWSQATAEEVDGQGHKVSISCWRSSDISQDDAHQSALNAAKRALGRLIRGERLDDYAYGERPMREEVLNVIADPTGEPWIAITRNSYGAVILNTAKVAFIDLDFPPATIGGQWNALFSRLMGKTTASADAQRESQIWNRLEQCVMENPGYGFRVYRTSAGLRALATHALFDPADPSTVHLLDRLGSDPLYVRLCKSQGCFRARLTPKPWRCGYVSNPIRWPREDARQQARFEKWEAKYTSRQAKFATCRLLGTLGTGLVAWWRRGRRL